MNVLIVAGAADKKFIYILTGGNIVIEYGIPKA